MVGKKLCTDCYYGDRYNMWCGKGQDTDTVTDKCLHYEEGPQPEPVYLVRDSNAWQVGEPIWDITESIADKGLALRTELADRIDSMYETIRRTSRAKRSPVIDDDVVALLRGQVSAFSTLLVDTLKGMGYHAATYQPCHTCTAEVYVYIKGLVIDVWDSLTARYCIHVDDDVDGPPLTAYRGRGQCVLGIRHVVECLAGIAATITAYRQCKDCYWSGEGSGYCGLGIMPVGVCSHYYSYYGIEVIGT